MCWVRGAFSGTNQGNEVNSAWFVLCEPMLIPNYHCLRTISWFFCLIRCSQTQQRIELKLFMSVFFPHPIFWQVWKLPVLSLRLFFGSFSLFSDYEEWVHSLPPKCFQAPRGRLPGSGNLSSGEAARGGLPTPVSSPLPDLCPLLLWGRFISSVVPEAQQELRESPFHQLTC